MKLKYYTRIIEDVFIDFVNITLLSKGRPVHCLNVENSIDTLIKNRSSSVIRWGDGESFVLMGANIHFQDSTPELRKRMLEVIKEYNDKSNYYLCLPDRYITCPVNELKSIETEKGNFYQLHKRTRYAYSRYFNKKSEYLSHFIFKDGAKLYPEKLRTLLLEFNEFIVVKSDPVIVDRFFNKFDILKKYSVVQIPGKNSFSSYEHILNEVVLRLTEVSAGQKTLVLISAGPCAKILVHDLSQMGYVAYDIGKLFESTVGL